MSILKVERNEKLVMIRDGYKILMSIYSPYRERIYLYNARIRDSGYYLKPIHIVYKTINERKYKYIYFGRYWYRIIRKGSKVKWVYIGREKPDPHLPDPPLSPFEGISVIVDENNNVIVNEATFKVINELAKRVINRDISNLATPFT